MNRRPRIRPWHVATLWATCLIPLTFWGLPSSRDDRFLFGDQPPWPADRYHAARRAEALRQRNAGADVDLDPLRRPPGDIVELTPDDEARGEILTRFRLYSRQPDEPITFRALQRMNPRRGDLDPRMFQYGGAWIYLVGACLGAAHTAGLVRITADVAFYLAQPDHFGRFYVVARVVSLAFAAAALIAIHRLAARAGGARAGWFAMALVGLSPVFLCGALEAKPHMPAAALTLWATDHAIAYLRRTRPRDALWMGTTAGLAAGFVLTGFAAALLWPASWLGSSASRRGRALACLLLAGGLALVVYFVTNPYVPSNLLFNRDALRSNLANTGAMYEITRPLAGAVRVGQLLVESVGWITPLAGLAGFAIALRSWRREASVAASAATGLLVLCVLIGAGKPDEFARFLLVPANMLAVAAAIAASTLMRSRRLAGAAVFIAALVAANPYPYLRSFHLDSIGAADSRTRAAKWLKETLQPGDDVALIAEPAPYSCPPIDFATRRAGLLPSTPPGDPDRPLPAWLIAIADARDAPPITGQWWNERYELAWSSVDSRLSRITWANKPVFIFRRTR